MWNVSFNLSSVHVKKLKTIQNIIKSIISNVFESNKHTPLLF